MARVSSGSIGHRRPHANPRALHRGGGSFASKKNEQAIQNHNKISTTPTNNDPCNGFKSGPATWASSDRCAILWHHPAPTLAY